jgi:Tfp pilus assembly protein PilF
VLTALAVSGCASNDTAKRNHLAAGNRYFDQQKFKEAIIEYRNAVQKDPRFGDARLKLAEAYERAM